METHEATQGGSTFGRTPPPTLTGDYQRDWPAYFRAVTDKPPRDTLLRALGHFEREAAAESDGRERTCIDLACGEGRDARELLRRSRPRWRVFATDTSREGLLRLIAATRADAAARLTVLPISMEDVAAARGLPASVDLVNASFALPFCSPEAFPKLWVWVLGVLRSGGRFAGQFFGERDAWAYVRPASHFSRGRVESLLEGFEVEHLEEVEKEGEDAMGGTKRHHVFHVVARRTRRP